MKILSVIAQFHNWLSDKDFMWWPFSFLRPERHVPMSFKDTSLMTVCFGGLAFIMFIVMAIMNNALTFDYVVSIFFSCFGGFFLWFNLITKPCWNYRAKTSRR